ncbi:GNAT family N-acetyltransferase [soil metagenome]
MLWHCLPFEQLSTAQLYQIVALREAVFVVEQNCAYLDADGKDPKCYHVWADTSITLSMTGLSVTPILAYARIVKPGVSYPEVSIGRVVTSADVRRTGLGRELMRVTIDCVYDIYGEVPIRISAQTYLEGFYQSLGFQTVTDGYLEDDIPHVGMLKRVGKDAYLEEG